MVFLPFSRWGKSLRARVEYKKETCFLPLFSMWSLSVTTLAVISVRMRRGVKTFITIASIFNLEKVVKSARNLVTTTVGTHYAEVRIWSKLICFVKFYLLRWKDWPIIIDLLAMHCWIASHPKNFRLQKFQIFPWHKFTKLKTIRELAKAHATNINSQIKYTYRGFATFSAMCYQHKKLLKINIGYTWVQLLSPNLRKFYYIGLNTRNKETF